MRECPRRTRKISGFQVVWDWGEWSVGFWRASRQSDWFQVYPWILYLGPLEIRRWARAMTREEDDAMESPI